MNIYLPDEEYIKALHDIAIKYFGGRQGVLHRRVLSHVSERPKNYIQYDECNLHKICAVILDTIAQEHPFTDGNKRTALLTTISTYRLNGVSLKLEEFLNGEFVSLMLWVVEQRPTVDEIADQLQQIVESYEKVGAEKALETIRDWF